MDESEEVTVAYDPESPRADLLTARLVTLMGQARDITARVYDVLATHPHFEAYVGLPMRRALRALTEQVQPELDRLVHATEDAASEAREVQAALAIEQAATDRFYEQSLSGLIHIGSDHVPSAWSLLGWRDNGNPFALSRDGGKLILGAGVQGCGKSVLITLLCEAYLQTKKRGLTSLADKFRAAVAVFHVEENDRLPQQLACLLPNPRQADLDRLERLGINGMPLNRVRLVMSELLLPRYQERLAPYCELGLRLSPFQLRLLQLGQSGLEVVLGAEEGAGYVQRMLEVAQELGDRLELDAWHRIIDSSSDLPSPLRRAAHGRLNNLGRMVGPSDGPGMWDMFAPNDLTIFHMGGPHMGHREVLPNVVALLNAMILPSPVHGSFHRVILIDEVNRFDADEMAWRAFTKVARMVRHQSSTLGLFGQDLLRVPDELFGLAGLIAVMRLRNPRVYQHLRERCGALRGIPASVIEGLQVAEAIFATTASTDPAWRDCAQRVFLRPPLCAPGGDTRAEA